MYGLNVKVPEKVPKTLFSVSFSRNSWRDISWMAILSSVWKKPCSLIITEFFEKLGMLSSSPSTLFISCRLQHEYESKLYQIIKSG